MVRQTQTQRLNFGVAEPITIANPGPYDWHVWRREPHGDVWLGFFHDDKVATEWAKTQKGNCVINNIPPSTSRHYITGTYKPGDLVTAPPRFSRPATVPTRKPKAERPVRSTQRQTLPNPFPTRSSKPIVETAEQKALKADASRRLEQHKQDEAADIAAGKTEVR